MSRRQADELLIMLEGAREQGVHSFEARRAFIGNPSERIRDLVAEGHDITIGPKERLNGRAWGVRYYLSKYAPAVAPGSGQVSASYPAGAPAALSPPSRTDRLDPAPVTPDPDATVGALFELPPPSAIYGDAA